ncbi:sulfatase [Akkermansiaceae bacterium]|nr:sulfatase [Akkermansiaceae bacterium]MDB4568954.1 sulfatase [Akkermansiaceae bacterium]MDB4735927.1 sulfatase [Akkermansiaceae bacterium]
MKAAFLILVLIGSLVGHEQVPPNIIFLMADDQNTFSMGCYGNPEVETPNMDRLANDGMIFDRHYDTTAICMGSRANVFTGMYEYKTGCNFVHGDMSKQIWSKSYPARLREAGYLTAFAGKFGIVVDGKGICEDEFDFYGGAKGQTNYATSKNFSMKRFAKKYPHSTLSYGAFGKEVIRKSLEKKKPFCLSISFKAPHRPTTPDARFDHVYQGKKFTKPANYGRRYGEHLSPQSKQGRQFERFESWGYDKNYDEVMAIYYQQIYAIDFALGMIRDELKSQKIVKNTVIIYTSDNGFICGSHGYGSKVLPMEESSRVPLIIFDPRVESSGKKVRCDRLTGNIDFAPTILELAGLEATENMDGRSLLPLLENPREGGHGSLALINTFPPAPTTCMSIVSGPFKYTYWWFENNEMKPTEELFNLKNDPLELTNLVQVPEHKKNLGMMRKNYDVQLKHWKKEAVKGNGYQKYITLFDRHLEVAEKAKILPSKKGERN